MFSRSPFRHLLWLLLPLHACSDPTYVTVHVTTDVPCERLQGVTLTVGKLGTLEDKVPTTRTAECNGNEIGTLTVVPSAEDDGEFGIRVLMGIERDVETCTSPAYGGGCVVARRGLRFLPGDSVELPIVMRQICNGIPCGPYDTCVRGSCVPATCKDSKTCTEDKLVEGGGPGDGGDVDSGDAAPLGPESEPVSLIEPYCGVATALDPKAAWAIRHGCVTRAGVSRFYGPVEQGFEANVIDNNKWTSITAEEGARAWGVKVGKPSTVTLERTPMAREVFYPGTPSSVPFSPAILPAAILYPHQGGVTLVPRTPTAPDFPKGDYTAASLFTGGGDTFLDAWVPYGTGAGPPDVLIMHDPSVDGVPAPKLRRFALGNPPVLNAGVPVVGTKYADPAISPDGNALYIASDQYIHAFDAKTLTTNWAVPAETALVGLVDRKQNFTTLVFVRPDGATMGDWVLRTYSPSGPLVGNDVTIVAGAIAGSLTQYSIALALIPGRADDLAIVSDGRDLYAIDLANRSISWKTADLPALSKAQLLSTPNVTYVATQGKLHAIAVGDGKVIFSKDTLWGAPTDIAIGPGHTLYITELVAPYRAGPKL